MTETLGWLWPALLLFWFFVALGDLESKLTRIVLALFLVCFWLKTKYLDFPRVEGWF